MNTPSVKRQRQREIDCIGSMVTLGNGSGTDFGASQCISMDLDAAAATDADCLIGPLMFILSYFGVTIITGRIQMKIDLHPYSLAIFFPYKHILNLSAMFTKRTAHWFLTSRICY